MRRIKLVIAIGCAFAFAACAPGHGAPTASPAPTPLATVSAVPSPSLPSLVDDVSPTTTADARTQIRVRFRADLIAVESLDASDARTVLGHFRIAPALPGRFRLLTPRMVGFESDAPLPLASRIAVTVTAGLTARQPSRYAALANDVTWTFETTPLDVTQLTTDAPDADPSDVHPDLHVTTNLPIDTGSLVAHAALVAPDGTRIGVVLKNDRTASETPAPMPTIADGDAAASPVTYVVQPATDLARGTTYTFAIAPGLAPRDGNVATTHEHTGSVRTYGPLVLEAVVPYGAADGTESATARFTSGTPQLRFSTPVTLASAATAIRVAPAPHDGRPLFTGTGTSRTIALNPYALDPATTYRITVDPTIVDAFGQHLAARADATFAVSHLAPDLWAPTGFAIFRSTDAVTLRASATNLHDGTYAATFHAIRPTDLIFADDTDPTAKNSLLPPLEQWTTRTLAQKPDVPTAIDIPLERTLAARTGLLAYGFAGAAATSTGLVQITDLGLFAQWFPTRGVVRVARLANGAPVAHAEVTVYPSLTDARSASKADLDPDACARGTTDATGSLDLRGAAFVRCELANAGDHEAPALLAVVRDGADWAFVRTTPYSNAWLTQSDATWTNGSPFARGELFTDRSLYQPGERAAITGIAYFLDRGTLRRASAQAYDLALVGPSGTRIPLGKRTPDAFGVLSLSYTFANTAERGSYTIEARAGDALLTGSLRVAEFKPPNFAVKLALDANVVVAGSTVTATTTSTYLFGGTVAGGSTRTFATRSAATYAPNGYAEYSFGRAFVYPESPPDLDPNVLETRRTIGADGIVRQRIAVPADIPFPLSYEVDAETTDASNLTVASSAAFTAFPTDAAIGLRASFTGSEKTALPVDVVVLGLDGRPTAGRTVHLALERATYTSETHAVEGAEERRERVSYAEAAHADIVSGTRPLHVSSLVPPRAGTYRVRATFGTANDPRSATDTEVWIAGAGEASWATAGTNAPVKLDRATYRVGDTAHVVVASPYRESDVVFTVIKNDVLLTQRVHATSGSVATSFPVTSAMLPNAVVQAFVVRRDPAKAGDAGAEAKQLATVGFAPFHVDLTAKRLRLTLVPGDATTHPGAVQHLHVHVVDAARAPVAGDVVVAVVDEAILQLSGYRFPDLVADVYADQPIAQRFADNRADVKLVTPKEFHEKGWGYGGGLSLGAAGTRVRTRFVPLAYYRADVHTDARGDADVAFAMPDTLTTWRVLAVALSRDARFGTADTTFVSTTPLVTNALLPQFARVGDRFDGGVGVTSPTHVGAPLAIDAAVASGGAAFVAGNTTTAQRRTETTLASATQAFRSTIVVTATAPPTFVFSSRLAGRQDTFRVGLPIRTQDVIERVVVAGRAAHATIPLAIDRDAADPTIETTVSTTIVGDLHEPMRALLDDEQHYGDAIAGRIAALGDLIVVRRIDPNVLAPLDAMQRASTELAALDTLARSDGAYREFPGDTNGFAALDAFVTTALARARDAGIPVGARLANVRAAVARELADPTRDASCGKDDRPCADHVRVLALAALAAAGDVRSTFAADLFSRRATLTTADRYTLARHLARLPAFAGDATRFARELGQRTYLTATDATVESDPFASRTAAQAAALELALATHDSTADAIVHALLAHRVDGHWGCACSDALALDALVDDLRLKPPPATATVRIAIDGGGSRDVVLTRAAPSATVAFTGATVRATHGVTIAASAPVSYATTYRYRLTGAVPGRYAGLRVDREIRPANATTVLAAMGLGPAAQPTLPVGGIFDVTVRITTDHDVDAVAIDDPLPAGVEAVDTTFATATNFYAPLAGSWSIGGRTIARDHVAAFAQRFRPGSYELHYLIRTVTPGTYAWPGAEARLRFAPDAFGRSAQTTLTVTP